MRPYYYIHKIGGTSPSVKHDTMASAVKEAERLAAKHPGDHFEILKAVAITHVPQSHHTFFLDTE